MSVCLYICTKRLMCICVYTCVCVDIHTYIHVRIYSSGYCALQAQGKLLTGPEAATSAERGREREGGPEGGKETERDSDRETARHRGVQDQTGYTEENIHTHMGPEPQRYSPLCLCLGGLRAYVYMQYVHARMHTPVRHITRS